MALPENNINPDLATELELSVIPNKNSSIARIELVSTDLYPEFAEYLIKIGIFSEGEIYFMKDIDIHELPSFVDTLKIAFRAFFKETIK